MELGAAEDRVAVEKETAMEAGITGVKVMEEEAIHKNSLITIT